MKEEKVYVGNIMVCTKIKDRYSVKNEENQVSIFKEDAILIRVKDGFYDLDDINSELDLVKASMKKKVYKTFYVGVGDRYVDEMSLKRYYSNEKTNFLI